MSFEAAMLALAGLNAAGFFALAGAVWRWVLRTERRLLRLEGAVWPDSVGPTR